MGFAIKRGDTKAWNIQLLQGSSGGGMDLTLAARIECFVYEQGSTVEVMDSTCSVPATTTYPSTQGWIRVAPTSSHVASTGHFDVEWEVEFTDGTFATWPNASMEELIISRDLKRT